MIMMMTVMIMMISDEDDLNNAELMHVRLGPCCQAKTAHLILTETSSIVKDYQLFLKIYHQHHREYSSSLFAMITITITGIICLFFFRHSITL